MITRLAFALLAAGIIAASAVHSQERGDRPVSMVIDWSSRHAIFTDPRSAQGRAAVDAVLARPEEFHRYAAGLEPGAAATGGNPEDAAMADPRFWQQQLRRYASAAVAEASARRDKENDRDGKSRKPDPPGRGHGHGKNDAVERDWTFSLNGGSGGNTASPAKFVFDVTSAPSCTNDFVVMGVNDNGAAGQANMIGLRNLYSNPGGTGLCAGTGPTVLFAYNIGPGSVPSNVALSLDGTKVAFIENNGASSTFHILTWKTGAGNGTSAAAAATPGTGNTAVDVKFALGIATTTAPFVDYTSDVAYVTDNSGIAHKYTGVFKGTPAEVTGGTTGWPLNAGVVISTPVFDSVTRHLFVTTANGIRYIDDSVTPAVLSPNTFNFTTGAGQNQQTPVIVDSTKQKVYAFGRNTGGTNALIAQADTSLSVGSRVTTVVGTGTANANPRQGDFNDAYYSGNLANARMYVTGNAGVNDRPVLYSIAFGAAFKMNNVTANGPLNLTNDTAGISVSPVTIFFNSTTSKEYLFVAVSNACSVTIAGGCIRSLDITSGFPVIGTVVLATSGGTGGITVDNNSSAAEAASVYFAPLTGGALVKATQALLN